MADERQLAVLRQGVDAWNAWKKQNTGVQVDLTHASLTGAKLVQANFSWAGLTGADLSGADLSGADLSGADLTGANLPGADLSGIVTHRTVHRTSFDRANLFSAKLSRAGLSGVRLFEANLSEADLTGADLRGASLIGADLSRANLSGGKGLKVITWYNELMRDHESKSPAFLAVGFDGTEGRLVLFSPEGSRPTNLSGARLNSANLSWANLSETILFGADLTGADLTGAYLSEAYLSEADFCRANLSKAKLAGADLSGAKLSGGADLPGAYLVAADLTGADLTGANLTGANLSQASLVGTNVTAAHLTGCRVYGISAWNVNLEGAEQKDLIITHPQEPEITVDNLEVAQFIYLLLKNERVRHVIDTITSKVVLILGRFTPERMAVLDALREELRRRDYLPVLFNFEKPASRSTEETVSTLAHMARFVIADLTDAKSVLQELRAIVPTNPSVPVQPLILTTQEEPGMFDFFRMYPWMLEPHRYTDSSRLLAAVKDRVIAPTEAKLRDMRGVSPPTP